jgi:hypothetical protein
MTTSQPMSPHDAEQVVADRIERFGWRALPELHVTERPDGRWLVRWDEHERTVEPMSSDEWCAWLEEHVGPLDAASLQTTES